MCRGVVSLLLDREVVLLHRFLVPAELMQRITELVMCFRIVGLQVNRFSQFLGGFGVAFEIVVAPTEIVLSGRIAGAEFETTFVRLRGLGVILRVVVIDVAETEMREAHVRLELNRCLILGDRFGITAEVSEGVTEFVMRFGIRGAIQQC